MIHFDPTINLGSILGVLTVTVAIIRIYTKTRDQLVEMHQAFIDVVRRIGIVEQHVERIENTINTQGQHLQRVIGRIEAGGQLLP